jgi:WD40 repeat protein
LHTPCICFSPDGQQIASGSYDAKSGAPLSEPLAGHLDAIRCLSFSPDGCKIASGSIDRTIRLWDAKSGAALGEALTGHTSYINCLSFSPDGHQIASGDGDKTIRLWNAESGAAAGKPIHYNGHINSVDLYFNNSDLFLTVNHTKVYNVSKHLLSSHAHNEQQFTSSSGNFIY